MKVNSKTELISFITANGSVIRQYGVAKLGVFGSFVRDEVRDDSDIDFVIDFEQGKKTLRNLVDLGDFLELHLGRKVEIITRESLSPYLGPKILSTTEYVPLAA